MTKLKLTHLHTFILLFTLSFGIISCSTDSLEDSQNESLEVDFKGILFDVQNMFNKTTTDSNSRLDPNIKYLTEDELQQYLEQNLASCVDFLRSRGFSDTELIDEFGSLNNPAIIASVDWIHKIEQVQPMTSSNTSARVKPNDWYDCLLRAVGIDTVIELINGKVSKQLAKKAIRKIVGKTLGWAGVAIALYEYGDCMGWY